MSKSNEDPSFTFHRDWVLKIIDTPSPQKQKRKHCDDDGDSLMADGSRTTEHVLRGSKSFTARSFRSRGHVSSAHFALTKPNNENIAVFADASQDEIQPPLIVSSKPHILGEIANNGQALRQGHWRLRTSPTPSIRKSKIEALVKHHGSPQHVRVTAGGRIVPSEQSPLCHPRFGYSAIKSNGALIKVAPNHAGKQQQWINTTQDGYVAEDVNGHLCQIVNGMIMPLNEVNGAVRLYVPAPNLNITQAGQLPEPSPALDETVRPAKSQSEAQAATQAAPQPSVSAQKNALELEYSKRDQELKDLDKTEVLHGSTMAKTAKDALFAKRRELVTAMDSVRRSLKSLNERPHEAQVPTSPKAMRDRQPLSPGGDRLPPFLQRSRQSNSVNVQPMAAPWQNMGQPAFGVPPVPMGAPLILPGNMPPNAANAPFLPFAMPSPGVFMPPPPFDGSMGAPFPAYQDPAVFGTSLPTPATAMAQSVTKTGVQSGEHAIPQHDGSTSSTNTKVASPRQSHALPIKDPETKQVTSVKSALNPMSPVYKPGRVDPAAAAGDKATSRPLDGRASTPLAFAHASKPLGKAAGASDNHTSPAKRKIIVDSSSVSSVKTADFFPCNTRDYSLRKHEYPVPTDETEDKENTNPEPYRRGFTGSRSPITPKRELHNTNWNPDIPDGAFVKFTSPQTESYAAPSVPPGTPVNPQVGGEKQPMLKIGEADWEDQVLYLNSSQMPDRVAHNLSPKSKRTWQFIEEHPSRYGSEDRSSPSCNHQCHEESCITSSPYKGVDFSNKSQDWIEGHQAGLYRKPVSADRMGDFLDGYCHGLLKSQPVTSVSMGIFDGSPARPTSRRPTPSPAQPSGHQFESSTGSDAHARPPMELNLQSLDSLKQAVYAPHNENALMTPAIDSSAGNEAACGLGAWQMRHEKVGGHAPYHPSFPQRASSLTERQTNQANARRDSAQGVNMPKAGPSAKGDQQFLAPKAPTQAPLQSRAASGPVHPTDRMHSITSIDSALYRPGLRVISPIEWKSPSSVAQAANLATGFFAHAQYDGTAMDYDAEEQAMLTHAAGISGAPHTTNRDLSSNSHVWRHRGVSLDGIDSPISNHASPPSTSPNLSPTTSPRLKAARPKKGTDSPSKKSSPTKSPSPAKAKFEHIASKVGISVSAEKKDHHEGSVSNPSPPSKKRWRDIWHGSSKKEGSKEEGGSSTASPAN